MSIMSSGKRIDEREDDAFGIPSTMRSDTHFSIAEHRCLLRLTFNDKAGAIERSQSNVNFRVAEDEERSKEKQYHKMLRMRRANAARAIGQCTERIWLIMTLLPGLPGLLEISHPQISSSRVSARRWCFKRSEESKWRLSMARLSSWRE